MESLASLMRVLGVRPGWAGLLAAAPGALELASRAAQAYTNADGTSVFRYTDDAVFIDRFFGGEWHHYGPYPKA